jgi:hypothetical protein
MRLIQTKGTVNNGEVTAKVPDEFRNGEVDIIIVAKDEPDEYDIRHKMIIEKGYDSPEKIQELIKKVKLEMLKEKGRA